MQDHLTMGGRDPSTSAGEPGRTARPGRVGRASRTGATLLALVLLTSACGRSAGDGADDRWSALGPAAAPEFEVLAETRTVIGEAGGVASVGEASLTVPAGSLAPGTVVLAQQLVEPAPEAASISAAATPGPVRFLTDGDVVGPLTISIPVRPGTDSVRILSAEEESILWFDEPTEVIDGFAVAEIDHLSTFDVSWASVSNLQYVLFRAIGARTVVPDCPQGPPDWVEDIFSSTREFRALGLIPNGPLLTCGDQVERSGEDLLALRIAANRGYSVVVRGPDRPVERRPLLGRGTGDLRKDTEHNALTFIADAIGSAVRPAGVEGERLYAIPALQTSEFLLPDPLAGAPGSRMVSFETVPPLDGRTLAVSILVDLLAVALKQVGFKAIEDLITCVQAMMSTSDVDGAAAALDVYEYCFFESPDEPARRWIDKQRWVQRLKTPVQIGLLTVERTVDMWNPDMIHIAVWNGAEQGSGQLPPETAWTTTAMWRGDAGRTGTFPAGAPTTRPDVLWTFRDGDAELSDTVVAAAGRVHATTVDGQLITLDLGTGTELWRFAPPGGAPLSIPSVTDGVVIVHAGGSGFVHALDAATGASRWQTLLRPTDDRYGTGPAETFVADGKVFITTMTTGQYGEVVGRVHGIRVSDGSIATSTDDRGFLFPSHVAADGGVLFVGGPRLEALRDLGRGVRWQETDYWGGQTSAIAVGSGRVHTIRYFNLGWLEAFDAETGAELWSTGAFSQSAIRREIDRFGGYLDLYAGPVVDSDTVYVGGWITDLRSEGWALGPAADPYGVLFAFDAATGEERWVTRLSGAVIGSPALSGDVLIVATSFIETENGHLYGIDRSTGRERWRIDSAGRVAGAFPIGDVLLVVDSGALQALR